MDVSARPKTETPAVNGKPSEADALAEMAEQPFDDSHTWMAIVLIGICAAAVAALAVFVLWGTS